MATLSMCYIAHIEICGSRVSMATVNMRTRGKYFHLQAFPFLGFILYLCIISYIKQNTAAAGNIRGPGLYKAVNSTFHTLECEILYAQILFLYLRSVCECVCMFMCSAVIHCVSFIALLCTANCHGLARRMHTFNAIRLPCSVQR